MMGEFDPWDLTSNALALGWFMKTQTSSNFYLVISPKSKDCCQELGAGFQEWNITGSSQTISDFT
jgi:hypothetical protein